MIWNPDSFQPHVLAPFFSLHLNRLLAIFFPDLSNVHPSTTNIHSP